MKRLKKFSFWFVLILFIGMIGMIIFSPYGNKEGYTYKLVKQSVEINAPPEYVFNYLGNSAHAHNWSVFVDHITSLNSDSFPDGTPGAIRRCFQGKNETGIWWDEKITKVESSKLRQLSIYNMHGFPIQSQGLGTEQTYEAVDGGKKCKLSFTVFYLEHNPSWFESLKTYFAGYKISSIFNHNISNVKRIVEKEYASRA